MSEEEHKNTVSGSEHLGSENKPLLVVLCGRPGSGKSTLAAILERQFQIRNFADSTVIKRHCMELFDLDHDACWTQEGKKRVTILQGVAWENRKILGEYAAILEEKFGDLTIPNWAIRAALREWEEAEGWRCGTRGYSFDSVRRDQGRAYKEKGAIIIEVTRPGVQATGNVWDEYNPDFIDHSFLNATTSLEELERAFSTFFAEIAGVSPTHRNELPFRAA